MELILSEQERTSVPHISKVHFVVSNADGKEIFNSHDYEYEQILYLKIYDQDEALVDSWELKCEKMNGTVCQIDDNDAVKKISSNTSRLKQTRKGKRRLMRKNTECREVREDGNDQEDHLRDSDHVNEETNPLFLDNKTICTRSTARMAAQPKETTKRGSKISRSNRQTIKNTKITNERVKNTLIEKASSDEDGISHCMDAIEDFENTELGGEIIDKNQSVPSSTEHERSNKKRTKQLLRDLLQCNICGVQYKSQIMLDKHKFMHETEKTDHENPLQCIVCKKNYSSWRSLTVHKRKHDASKNNVCEPCGKRFRTKQELTRHSYVHSNQKSSPCHICGKLFKNKAYAQMHSKLHSQENRKHQCNVCGKYFLRGPDIQKHMRIHTGEKPYICAQCGRSFSESSHLIRHERLHSGDKPYECEKCHQRFTHKEALTRHSFSHMEHLPYSCEVCQKGFITKQELDIHWLVHDKPSDTSQMEICQLCGKTFSHALYLRYHMRHHKNIGRYQCNLCYKVFKKPLILENHVTREHPGSELQQRNEHAYSVIVSNKELLT